MRDSIVIEREIKAPIDRVFDACINPEDLVIWHNAGQGWQTPYAQVDAVPGGKIKIAYAGPQGEIIFDFEATIEQIQRPSKLHYRLGIEQLINNDSRLVTYDLSETQNATKLRLEFDIEHLNDKEMQRQGWTSHVDNLQRLLEQ